MGPHGKTVLTLVTAVTVITFLCFHPNVAWRLYQGMFGLIGLGILACIYGAIYHAFDNGPKHAPPDDEAKLAAFDPVI